MIIFFLIKIDFKSNFCVFINKDPNYDYARYDETSSLDNLKYCNNVIEEILNSQKCVQDKKSVDDNFEELLSPRIKTQTRSRMPIYYNNLENDQSQEQHVTKSYSDSSDYRLPWHSTQLDFDSNNGHDLHNTEDSQYLKTVNSIESSPNVSDVQTDNSNDSTCVDCLKTEREELDIETIYACCLNYNAIHRDDLTVNISDRVHIINDSGADYVLVKHIKSQKCGYIPRICILNVNKFLADLM